MVAGGQVADGEQVRVLAVDECRRLGEVDGPDAAGLDCLSMRIVRRETSGSRDPAGTPLGLSINPAGPSASNFFCQE